MAAAGLAIALSERGEQVRLMSATAPGLDASHTVLDTLGVPLGLGVELVEEVPGSLGSLTAQAFAKPLARCLPETDVVHLHGVWDPPLLRAAALALRHHVPFVLCPHGMWSPWSLQQRWLKKALAWRTVYRHVYRHASAIHCLSPNEERFARSRDLDVPLHRIPNGVDLPTATSASSELFLTEHPELNGTSFFLFVGRFHVTKGLDLLLPAFERYVERGGTWNLVLIGPDGGDGTERQVERRLQASPTQSRVHRFGAVYGAMKFSALKASSALVHPSRQEAFSMSITEALACARPVVVSRNAQFDDVSRVEAGIVTELDVAAIADALWSISSSPERAVQMGQRGRELVEANYTWSRVAERAVRVYERCLER